MGVFGDGLVVVATTPARVREGVGPMARRTAILGGFWCLWVAGPWGP